jgi:hypothetical protein
LQRACELLRAESPLHYDRLCGILSHLAVRLSVGEELLLHCREARLQVTPAAAGADVRVRASLAAALVLLDGERTLEASLHEDAIDVFGGVEALLRAAEVMEIFLHGLVRCPSAGVLMDDLRTLVKRGNEHG